VTPQTTIKTNHARLWATVGLLLMVTALGARMLNADIVFVDEYWSIFKSGTPPYGSVAPQEIYRRIIEVDPGGMGALYYFSLGAWGSFLGDAPFVVRLYSLFYGVLAVAGMARLGREMFGAQVGFYGAVVLGLSAFFIDYLHEARAYTQVAFYTVLVAWCYWRGRSSTAWGWRVGVFASMTALAYSHYVALSVGAVLGVFHLLTFRRSRAWWGMMFALVLAGLAYAPWLTVAFGVAERGVASSRADTSMRWYEIAPNLIVTFANANVALWALLAWMGLRLKSLEMRLIWLWLGVSLLLVILINALIPFMVHLRYLIFLFPPLALWVAVGMRETSKRGVPIALLLVVWGGAGVLQSLNPAFIAGLFGQIYRAPSAGLALAQAHLRTHSTAQDSIIWHFLPPDDEPFGLFVLDYLTEGIPHAKREQVGLMNLSQADSDNEYLQAVNEALNGIDAVWTAIVPNVPFDNNLGVVQYVLNTQFSLCDAPVTHPDGELRFYLRHPVGQGASNTLNIVAQRMIHEAQGYRVSVLWDASALPTGIYSVGLHLLDENGALLRQSDAGLPDVRPYPCQTLSINADGLTEVAYQAVLVVYEWQTGERLMSYPLELTP